MPPILIILLAILATLLLLFLLYLLVLVRPKAKRPADPALLCDYAHRGLHGERVPENSLRAFALACEQGRGIELDVQLSRDGRVMVFHDYSLKRMTGVDQKLRELTAAELQGLSLKGTDQTIPTFAEALALVDGRVPLLVELKGENLNTTLCKAVAEHLSAYRGAFCIESFNPLLVRGMKKCLPEVYGGLLYTNVCRDKKKYSLLNVAVSCMLLNCLAGPNFIAYNQLDRGSLPVKLAAGLYRAPRFVWTARSDEDYQRAHDLGEHPIFENLTQYKEIT